MDRKEMEFHDAVARRPDTLRKYVINIYRLKTNKRYVVGGEKDEVLIYFMAQEVQDHSDRYISLQQDFGYTWNLEARMTKNAQGQPTGIPQVQYEYPIFSEPFSPENVDKIMGYSLNDVDKFYVGYASERGPNITTGDYFAVKNKRDFKEGTFEELMDMSRYNYCAKESMLDEWRQEGSQIKKRSQTITSLTQKHGGTGR